MIDALAFEPQFLAHIAPVWTALPDRGQFLVAPELMVQAEAAGISAVSTDPVPLRRSSFPPKANPGAGPTALVASIGDIKVGRRLGYRRFVLMQHGAGQSYGGDSKNSVNRHPSYPGGMDNEDVGLFLTPNEHSAERWRRAYPPASVAVVGCPKLDTLPEREPGPGPVIALTFHWPTAVCPETLPAYEFIGALPALAKRYTVLGHGHPRWAQSGDGIRRACRRAGIEYVPDFDEVCRRADLLAFDNSSVGFEFAATGRPVVVMNGRGYRRNAHHGLRFWDAASVGVQVDLPDRLPAAIDTALSDAQGLQDAREEALAHVYAFRSGAAQRASAAIVAWLGERVEVAA